MKKQIIIALMLAVCSFSFAQKKELNSINNLGPSGDSNVIVLWDPRLPQEFKKMCADGSIHTNGIEYMLQNYNLTRNLVFKGGKINLYKLLLLVLNQGRDNLSKAQVAPNWPKLNLENVRFNSLLERLEVGIEWLAQTCIGMSNNVYFMQDKYDYERLGMALRDTQSKSTMLFELDCLSQFVNILSASKYGTLKPIYNFNGQIIDIETKGKYPRYGEDDPGLWKIQDWVERTFVRYFQKYQNHSYGKVQLKARIPQSFIDLNALEQSTTQIQSHDVTDTQQPCQVAQGSHENEQQPISQASIDYERKIDEKILVKLLDKQYRQNVNRVKVQHFGSGFCGK
eukprot:TRINITY_DN3965_c0_g2_i1.p1 TRINITY_DN3965_c0_g2~~TRINITY_DN3965_c0_g2_i1.p1  ORF type:complete len:340 (+),score=9.86 TRINITY_DN3965_c0_g2_i1:46-1065(+)